MIAEETVSTRTVRLLPIHQAVESPDRQGLVLRCAPNKADRIVRFLLEHYVAVFERSEVTCRFCLESEGRAS